MADLWLISVPLDKTSSSSVEQLKLSIAKTNQASCCKFSIPDLKVRLLVIFLLNGPICLCSGLLLLTDVVVTPCSCRCIFFQRVLILSCVTRFQWDKAKYPTALPLSSLVDIINKDVSQVETELTSRAAAYSSLNTSLQSLECKLDGGLLTRSLNGIIRKEDLVVSEYLTTVLVVVSRGSYLQWEKTYESLSEFVVPRSSRKLYEDGEGGIFSVTLFKRAVFDFKAKAQEKRFTLREYSFDLEEEKLQERKQLSVYKNEQYGTFVRWLKVNYSEMFTTWIHLKALRVFVESVLRYGLPVRYQALLLHTDSKSSRKVKEELASLFRHLDPTANQICDIPGLCQQEYFSYVCFDINTKVLEITEQSASVRGTHCSIKQ
uniref:V-type proton ATPase subunit C n=1 Tax=Cynoglossus semilaevis TaxID=244447 RepID=A0A3P8WQK1_CYNSE